MRNDNIKTDSCGIGKLVGEPFYMNFRLALLFGETREESKAQNGPGSQPLSIDGQSEACPKAHCLHILVVPLHAQISSDESLRINLYQPCQIEDCWAGFYAQRHQLLYFLLYQSFLPGTFVLNYCFRFCE